MRGRDLCRGPLILTLLLALPGCREAEETGEPAPLETVEVSERPDVLVDPSQDPVERRRPGGDGPAGVLPSDFPSDLPTPRGASIVDFEDRAVIFLVARSPAAVRSSYGDRLRSAGWSSSGGDRWARSGREVSVGFEAEGPSTRIRVGY